MPKEYPYPEFEQVFRGFYITYQLGTGCYKWCAWIEIDEDIAIFVQADSFAEVDSLAHAAILAYLDL